MAFTRRDFINGTLAGTGAALLNTPPNLYGQIPHLVEDSDWYGYGGVGDYARSHGNTPEAMLRAHELRDGVYHNNSKDVIDTGEIYDVVVVGCGFAGLGAALEFTLLKDSNQTCLMLDNHPIFGGEAKRNEFRVNGELLIGPQGSNGFSIPRETDDHAAEGDPRYYAELNIPRGFNYQAAAAGADHLKYPQDNYDFQYWTEHNASIGYHVKDNGGAGRWVRSPWDNGLKDMPYSNKVRQDLLAWRNAIEKPYQGKDFKQWMDSMSYKDLIENEMKLSPEVTSYADPIVASSMGSGCDAVSAFAAYSAAFPGVNTFFPNGPPDFTNYERHSFPGGNDGFSRHFVKRLIPDAISGSDSFTDILNGKVNFEALDRQGQPVRMRLGSTVVDVSHDANPQNSDYVIVKYTRGNSVYRVRARGVVMATGGWVNKHVVRDLPYEHSQAYQQFHHAAFLIANVALTNWRFLHKTGITCARWDGGFGFSCNIRRPMVVGDYQPPLDPNKPIILTFYKPFYYPGKIPAVQGILGRSELFSTSYANYETQIMQQLVTLFGASGFNPNIDVTGLILNRWGHAYVIPEPGYYYGTEGKPANRDVIRQSFGRIAFGHSELHGVQHWGPAASEGSRALKQVFSP